MKLLLRYYKMRCDRPFKKYARGMIIINKQIINRSKGIHFIECIKIFYNLLG